MTKIQVRKQFTTTLTFRQEDLELFSIWRRYKFESNSQHGARREAWAQRCFQYDEDTSSKAIHNSSSMLFKYTNVVFNMTKIQVRKQFTTPKLRHFHTSLLFSIWRRYKFESNSQHYPPDFIFQRRCFQYDEDTSSKAIHNISCPILVTS